MRLAPSKTSKICLGTAFAFAGIWVSEIKPTSFKFLALSFDLSLAPDVVGALPPAVSASLQVAGFALSPVEGSGLPNPPSQALVLDETNVAQK